MEEPGSAGWSREVARAADRWEESDFARTERGLIFVVDGGGIADVPFARARDGGRREAMAGDESERRWSRRGATNNSTRARRVHHVSAPWESRVRSALTTWGLYKAPARRPIPTPSVLSLHLSDDMGKRKKSSRKPAAPRRKELLGARPGLISDYGSTHDMCRDQLYMFVLPP